MKKYIFGGIFLLVAFIVASIAVNAQTTSVRDLSGWAWSSNVGWVSFNSTNPGVGTGAPYKVQLQTNGDLTGYAWSSNVGWIKFDGLSDFPSGGAAAHVDSIDSAYNNAAVTGWVRACAGTINGDCSNSVTRIDGWDGWISLSGDNYSTSDSSGNGGVTYVEDSNIAYLKGFSWGSDVVGWLKFSPTASVGTTLGPEVTNQVTASITANTIQGSISIAKNSTPTIRWSSTGASICTGTNFNTSDGINNSTDGVDGKMQSDNPITYTVTCTNTSLGGRASASVTVNKIDTPADFSCVKPSQSTACTTNGTAIIYNGPFTTSPNPLPQKTNLVNSCPTNSGNYYCTYTCDFGYKINGNNCVFSSFEHI